MKKITIILLFMFGAFTVSMAQTTSATPNSTMTAKKDKAALAAQKKSDREAKALAKKQAKPTKVPASTPAASSAHLNKNGTPDKRFKANKQVTTATKQNWVQNTTPASISPSASSATNRTTTHVARTNMPKVADKSLGADAQGRTIYQGPRGGKYYINKNGNKEYVK